jgi:DNA primase
MDQNARATDEVLALVPKIANEVKRDLYLQRAAGELRIPENTLRARAASLQRPQRTPGRPAAPAAGPELSRGAARTAQNDIIEFLMKAPAESGDVFHDVSPEDFPDPPYRRIYITIRDLREGDGQVDPAAVLHTLESRSPGSSEAGLVAEILAADCENLAERARGSLAWFSKQRRQKEVSTLKQQLKEAQSRGDTASVRQLLEQVRSLSGPALEGAASSR